MSEQRDLDRLLGRWLHDGPTSAPDRVLDVLADRIERQSQRPGWFVDRRSIAMPAFLKYAAAAMAVLIVIVAAYALGAGGRSSTPLETSAPTATTAALTSTPAPSPSVTVAPSPSLPGVGAVFSGTLPAGWSIGSGGIYAGTSNVAMTFVNDALGYDLAVEVLPRRWLMAADCALEPEPGVDTTAAAIVGQLEARPGLATSGRTPFATGTLTGLLLDVRGTGGGPCVDDAGRTGIVPLLGYFAGPDWLYIAASPGSFARFGILDLPGGGNVVIGAFAKDQAIFDAHADEIDQILDGIEIDV